MGVLAGMGNLETCRVSVDAMRVVCVMTPWLRRKLSFIAAMK